MLEYQDEAAERSSGYCHRNLPTSNSQDTFASQAYPDDRSEEIDMSAEMPPTPRGPLNYKLRSELDGEDRRVLEFHELRNRIAGQYTNLNSRFLKKLGFEKCIKSLKIFIFWGSTLASAFELPVLVRKVMSNGSRSS